MNGTDEKRRLLLKGIATTALCTGLSVRLMAREGAEQNKLTKEEARYQSHPEGEKRCGNCTNFISKDNTCQRVEGNVSPEGYCRYWEAAREVNS